MKKISYILSLFLFFCSSASAMTDISGTKNETAIIYLTQENIINGYADDTFRPQNHINRAEFTKIITNAFFSQSQISDCDTSIVNFSDTDFSAWYLPYLCSSVNWGVIDGYPDGTFHPEKNISFVEAAKMLAKIELKTESNNSAVWYEDYVKDLEAHGAIPDSIKSFDQTLSRGEVAEMVYRLHADITDQPQTTYTALGGGKNIPTQTIASVKSNTQKATTNSEITTAILKAVNTYRTEKSLSNLKINQKLNTAAQLHADDMIAQNYFDHTNQNGFTVSDRVAETGYFENAKLGWSVGENIAWGQETVDNVMRSWMNSSSHKGNILNEEFTEMGVGFACGADDSNHQRCKWVQVFATKYDK